MIWLTIGYKNLEVWVTKANILQYGHKGSKEKILDEKCIQVFLLGQT